MTSKISFRKMLIDDIKKRSWVLAFCSIWMFLALPVMCTMNIQVNRYDYNAVNSNAEGMKDFLKWLTGYLTFDNIGVRIAVLVLAVVCGVTGYSFLHSREKLDFYHSLPITRGEKYRIQYISGLFIFAVPYVISHALSYLIPLVQGYVIEHLFKNFILSLTMYLLLFVMFYSLTILAMILTGKTMLGILGAIIFFIYPLMIEHSIKTLFDIFFKTHFERSGGYPGSKYSPIVMYINLDSDKIDFKIVLAMLAISLVTIIFSYILYGRRPSEAAEESIAYSKTESIIKILLAIPIGIFIGYCMEAIFMISDSTVLFSATCIISVFIVCCIIEFIYHLNMKMLVKHWKSLLVSVGMMLLLISICEMDMFHYDEYIPDKTDVKELDISIPDLESYFQYASDVYYYGEMSPVYSVKSKTSKETVYKMVEKGISRLDKLDEYKDSEFCVRYKMKNGRVIYRRYYMKQEDMLEDLNTLCMDEKMRKEIIPIESMNLEEINKLEVYDEEYGETIFEDISKAQIKPLLEVYKKELSQMSIQEMNDSEIIGSFRVEMNSEQEYEDGEAESDLLEFKIYSNLSETLKLLKEYGCELKAPEINPDEVKSIILCKWIEETGEEERTKINMEDTEKVQDVLDNITNSYGIFVDPYEEEVTVEIKMKDGEMKIFYIRKEYFSK